MSQKSGKLILVVDDEPVILQTASLILETQGYEVLLAENGVAALEALSTTRPHVLISDLAMPRMNGFELLSIVRERYPEIGVIVVTGHYTGPSQNLMTDAFFVKANYPLEQFFAAVSDLVAKYPIRPPRTHLEGASV